MSLTLVIFAAGAVFGSATTYIANGPGRRFRQEAKALSESMKARGWDGEKTAVPSQRTY